MIYIEYYVVNVISARVSARGTGISPSPEGEGWYQTEGWNKGMRSHLPCNVVCIIYLKQRFVTKISTNKRGRSNTSSKTDPPPPFRSTWTSGLRVISRRILRRFSLALACLGTFGLYFSTFYTSCFAKDHWWGFSTRNAHMVHIVNLIRFKMVYTS